MNLLDASCRVAFAALIHDLGKFAQRADSPKASRFSKNDLDGNLQTYGRFKSEGGYFTHQHAAYTALAFDELESKWPDVLRGDVFPFASRTRGEDITDSIINAAAAHHKPDSFLQWIVATADRLASGFEREEFEKYNAAEDKTDTGRNHYQARLLPLFEGISLGSQGTSVKRSSVDYGFRYPLHYLSAEGIFPDRRESCEPDNDADAQAQYGRLWDAFTAGLEKIPPSHRASWALWLDHFDSLWLAFTQAIPSATAFGVRPDVSLYDHSKASAALAVALWRFAHATGATGSEAVHAMRRRLDWDESKFLLVQGDFFGIQDFIFAEGAETSKQAAKILRGRSFQVSLFAELAALRVLELLELPSTSQIINAAGKFLIVAPNTETTVTGLLAAKEEFDSWFLRYGFGLAGIGLAWKTASCNDFSASIGANSRFSTLMRTLFENLETAKFRRYDLCSRTTPVLEADFASGPCAWNGKLPADDGMVDGKASCALSRDQKLIGQSLTERSRVLIVREKDAEKISGSVCELPVFGYKIMFAGDESERGKFGELAASGALRRCWDFSPPRSMDEILWTGYARRHINGYVPRFSVEDMEQNKKKYSCEMMEGVAPGALKTFNHIACGVRGQSALTVLKGDVDNLGMIFQQGLNNPAGCQRPTFAKMAALSRQMNAFFAIYLPALCATEYPDVYTVFAGGDDFFLIGPWLSTQKLAADMAEKFRRYVAENLEIHFSAGMIMKKPGSPVYALAEEAEESLARAKKADGKNAFCLFGVVRPWPAWAELAHAEAELARIQNAYGLSTGFIYGLLHLLKMHLEEKEKPEASLWRSRLAYRTARMLDRQRDIGSGEAQRDIVTVLGAKGIAKLKEAFLIPLFNHLYQQR